MLTHTDDASKIMVPDGAQNVTVYDPAAGSGTLVLALAHEIGEENCTIYTQDISQKSNEFLRLNLILNNLVHSLGNVIHGNTIVQPEHLNKNKDGLMKFDYIVSNPPFNVDFSDDRDTLTGENYKERFWAGVPKKDKDKMAIYLMFIQHILFSLKEDGKAAIVVPTIFLTAGSGIPKALREFMVKQKIIKGAISMPPNIFANTGTQVSIIFIDKSIKTDYALFVDASNFGEKIKVDGKNQKTVLNDGEIDKIISTFSDCLEEDNFSIRVPLSTIEQKKYSFSAGQYFKVEVEHIDISEDEFEKMIQKAESDIKQYQFESVELNNKLIEQLRRLRYE